MISSRLRIALVIAYLFPVAFSLLPSPAFAQQCIRAPGTKVGAPQEPCKSAPRRFITNPACACCGDCELKDFVGLAVEVSRYIFGIAGSLALVMFAVGGFWWLTAAGSAERIGKGKQTLVAAVVGLMIIFGAWVFVNTLLAALTGQLGGKDPVKILGGEWWKVSR